MYLLSRSLVTLTKHTKPIFTLHKAQWTQYNKNISSTLAETLQTVTVTFDEQDISRVHVIIRVASFHYNYTFLFLCTFFAKRATKEADMVTCFVCTSVRPAVSRFPYILLQENLDGLR